MSPAQYRKLRQKLGTWKHVAGLLGVNWSTIARREAGTIPITTEAALAIDSLAGRAAGAGGVPKARGTKKGKAPNDSSSASLRGDDAR